MPRNFAAALRINRIQKVSLYFLIDIALSLKITTFRRKEDVFYFKECFVLALSTPSIKV